MQGMLKFLGLESSENKNSVVSLLEDAKQLNASEEFKAFLHDRDNVDAQESYDFLCNHIIRKCPVMMEKRFGEVISTSFFGLGRVVNFMTREFGVNKLMVDGMLQHHDEVTNIFANICGKKNLKKDFIKLRLNQELSTVYSLQQRNNLLFGVGSFTTSVLLQCICENKKKLSHAVIQQLGKKKDDETNESCEHSDQKNESDKYSILTKIVTQILDKCTSDAKGWKNCFGEMTIKAYEEKEEIK
jgi:hypothetical protein